MVKNDITKYFIKNKLNTIFITNILINNPDNIYYIINNINNIFETSKDTIQNLNNFKNIIRYYISLNGVSFIDKYKYNPELLCNKFIINNIIISNKINKILNSENNIFIIWCNYIKNNPIKYLILPKNIKLNINKNSNIFININEWIELVKNNQKVKYLELPLIIQNNKLIIELLINNNTVDNIYKNLSNEFKTNKDLIFKILKFTKTCIIIKEIYNNFKNDLLFIEHIINTYTHALFIFIKEDYKIFKLYHLDNIILTDELIYLISVNIKIIPIIISKLQDILLSRFYYFDEIKSYLNNFYCELFKKNYYVFDYLPNSLKTHDNIYNLIIYNNNNIFLNTNNIQCINFKQKNTRSNCTTYILIKYLSFSNNILSIWYNLNKTHNINNILLSRYFEFNKYFDKINNTLKLLSFNDYINGKIIINFNIKNNNIEITHNDYIILIKNNIINNKHIIKLKYKKFKYMFLYNLKESLYHIRFRHLFLIMVYKKQIYFKKSNKYINLHLLLNNDIIKLICKFIWFDDYSLYRNELINSNHVLKDSLYIENNTKFIY